MKKVLIVEDEILARLGLRQLVDWKKLELELLPDATDGEEALEMIRNSCPAVSYTYHSSRSEHTKS